MKKQLLFTAFATVCSAAYSQQASGIKTFKEKSVKLREANIYDVEVDPKTKSTKITSIPNRGNAEEITLGPDFTLTSRQDLVFDYDAEKVAEEKKETSSYKTVTEDGKLKYIIQEDLIRIKPAGMDMLANWSNNRGMANTTLDDYGRIGITTAGGVTLEKGRIVRYAYSTSSSDVSGFSRNVRGVQTAYEMTEKVKLKSEAETNLLYEFHKTIGDQFRFVNNAFGTASSMEKQDGESKLMQAAGYNVDVYRSKTSNFNVDGKRNILINGDILLLTKRKAVIKFGQKPSDEDLLPYYYVHKINRNTLGFSDSLSFKEPVDRAIIFKNNLSINGGMLIVSAPVHIPGQTPKDENAKNYVIRWITDEVKMGWELPFTAPSGYTRFTECFESTDGSIVLIANCKMKKADKHFNKMITPPDAEDDLFILVIKDGKIISQKQITSADWLKQTAIVGQGKGSLSYTPALHTLRVTDYRFTDNGGTIIAGHTPYFDGAKNLNKNAGDFIFHFDKSGNLVSHFWAPGNNLVAPAFDPQLVRASDNEFYWINYASQETSENQMIPTVTKVDVNSGKATTPVVIGDSKHVVNTSISPILDAEAKQLYFFGFDKGGKEFWTQSVMLN